MSGDVTEVIKPKDAQPNESIDQRAGAVWSCSWSCIQDEKSTGNQLNVHGWKPSNQPADGFGYCMLLQAVNQNVINWNRKSNAQIFLGLLKATFPRFDSKSSSVEKLTDHWKLWSISFERFLHFRFLLQKLFSESFFCWIWNLLRTLNDHKIFSSSHCYCIYQNILNVSILKHPWLWTTHVYSAQLTLLTIIINLLLTAQH